MRKLRALDLYCGAGGISVGLERAGFEVSGVDIGELVKRKGKPDTRRPHQHYCGGTYVQADCLEVLKDLAFLQSFDFIHASPPCQAHSSLRHLSKGKVYPDLIPQTRAGLMASGVPYSIENVEGAPLGGWLTMLCGTMFGLVTPDGRAEIRRHRLFETSFSIALRPQCQHGGYVVTLTGHSYQGADAHSRTRATLGIYGEGSPMVGRRTLTVVGAKGLPGMSTARREALSVNGTGLDSNRQRWAKRRALGVTGHAEISRSASTGSEGITSRRSRAISVTGNTAQTNVERIRETFTIDEARAAMGIDWMPMKDLSQAIPPAYGEWLGRQAIAAISQD